MKDWTIRDATATDAPALAELILGLADYERLRSEAQPDLAALARHLEPDASPRCEALLAVDEHDTALGFALFFPNYSTFLTGWGLYLEDLFVLPAHRGRGIGLALFKGVANRAVARGARRLDWSVLDWNEPAIGFYQQLGATAMDDWRAMRLSDAALQALGAVTSGTAVPGTVAPGTVAPGTVTPGTVAPGTTARS